MYVPTRVTSQCIQSQAGIPLLGSLVLRLRMGLIGWAEVPPRKQVDGKWNKPVPFIRTRLSQPCASSRLVAQSPCRCVWVSAGIAYLRREESLCKIVTDDEVGLQKNGIAT